MALYSVTMREGVHYGIHAGDRGEAIRKFAVFLNLSLYSLYRIRAFVARKGEILISPHTGQSYVNT